MRSLRVTQFALVGYGLFLFAYSIIIVAAHNNQSFVAWMASLEPAVHTLSSWIPALERVPADLLAKGNVEWASAAQHMLFAGWSLLIPIAVWMLLDVLVVNRHTWGRMYAYFSTATLVKFTLLILWMLVGLFLILLGGVGAASGRKSLGGPVGIVMLAFGFFAVAALLFAFMVSANALLWRLLYTAWGGPPQRGTPRRISHQEEIDR